MRPVNLIPPEDRRGQSAPSRAGAMSYVVVGVLAVILLGIIGVVLTNKQVSDRKAEVANLEAQQTELQARAATFQTYVDFQTIEQSRTATITSLAQSRFDWERVMRELSLVLPDHIWLTSLRGTVRPGVTLEGDSVQMRDSVPGPALELIGCGRSQRDVARLVAALNDIDGVTRVTATKSEKPDNETSGGSTSVDECRTRQYIPRFQIVAAFDEVPAPAVPGATTDPSAPAPAAPATPPPPGEDANSSAATETASTGGNDGGVSAAESSRNAEQGDIADGQAKADNAMKIVGAG
jgi:Tfp pilus assembly protein PilN